jgi:hypothetical protein
MSLNRRSVTCVLKYAEEFPYFDDSRAYYREAMLLGRLRVNDEVSFFSYYFFFKNLY